MRQATRSFVLALFGVCALALPLFALGATDNVLSANIKEADGTTGQDTNTGSGIKTAHIQDGAVTPAKIAGPGYAPKYANVIVVSKDGRGDFTDPVAAVASITNASATNTYLVKILPGVYPIAAYAPVQAKSFVDIEGSGMGITRLVLADSPGWGGAGPYVMVSYWPDQGEVRDLTLELGGLGGGVLEIGGGTSPNNASLSRVHIKCATSSPTDHCNAMMVMMAGGEITLRDVVITTSGAYDQAPLYFNDRGGMVRMLGGRFDSPGPAVISNCFDPSATSAFYGAGVEVDGPLVYPGSTPGCGKPAIAKCVNCFTSAFDALVVP